MEERSVGIVLPAYRPDWERTAAYAKKLLRELKPQTLIIETDVERPQVELPDRVEVHFSPERRGKGAAVSDGFDRLDTDILLFADADGSVPVSSLEEIVERLEEGIAVGSRRHPAAEIVENQTRVRKMLGDLFSGLAGRMLPLEVGDYQCGAKAVTAELWDDIGDSINSTGFSWDLELVTGAWVQGYDVEEVPVTWKDRQGSTVPVLRTSIEMLLALVESRSRVSRRVTAP